MFNRLLTEHVLNGFQYLYFYGNEDMQEHFIFYIEKYKGDSLKRQIICHVNVRGVDYSGSGWENDFLQEEGISYFNSIFLKNEHCYIRDIEIKDLLISYAYINEKYRKELFYVSILP